MAVADRLSAMLTAARAHRADDDDGPVDLRDAGEREDEAAELREQEDAARRSREASLSRADLIDYAQFRGVRLTAEEQVASMDNLRRIVLERLAGLAQT